MVYVEQKSTQNSLRCLVAQLLGQEGVVARAQLLCNLCQAVDHAISQDKRFGTRPKQQRSCVP